jgi:hypothetical protein
VSGSKVGNPYMLCISRILEYRTTPFHIIVQYFAHCWYFFHIVTHRMQAPATTFLCFTHTHVLNYIALLDRSLSLTQVPAETGALIFLCGGDQELYDSQATYLDAMGKVKAVYPIHCYFMRVALFLCFYCSAVVANDVMAPLSVVPVYQQYRTG